MAAVQYNIALTKTSTHDIGRHRDRTQDKDDEGEEVLIP